MKASVEASTALMEASIRSMKAYGRYGTFHEEKIPEASTEASMEAVKDAAEVTSTEAFTKASTSTKASAKASTEVLQRKLPRIRKLPRKHFNVFLDFSSTEAIGSFRGRSEAQRLPRKLPRKLFLKATSTEFYVLLPLEASAASTESQRLPRQLPRIYLYCTLLCLQWSLPLFRQHG